MAMSVKFVRCVFVLWVISHAPALWQVLLPRPKRLSKRLLWLRFQNAVPLTYDDQVSEAAMEVRKNKVILIHQITIKTIYHLN